MEFDDRLLMRYIRWQTSLISIIRLGNETSKQTDARRCVSIMSFRQFGLREKTSRRDVRKNWTTICWERTKFDVIDRCIISYVYSCEVSDVNELCCNSVASDLIWSVIKEWYMEIFVGNVEESWTESFFK